MGDSGDQEDIRYRPPIDYKRGDFSPFFSSYQTDHEGKLIDITKEFYKISSFDDVSAGDLTQIIKEITACHNLLSFPATESSLSDRERQLQAKFNEYFENNTRINHDNNQKKYLLKTIKDFFSDYQTDHESNLVDITKNFYGISSLDDVDPGDLTQIIKDITACHNLLSFPATESSLSVRERQLQAKFNEYFDDHPRFNRDNEQKKYLLETVNEFFNDKISKKSKRAKVSRGGLLLLSKGEGKRKSGYKRKTSKKHRKRHSSRKKHRKHRTRRH